MQFSPIVGIFGHRQVGKTTFCEGLSGTYLTLDQKKIRTQIAEDPDLFLNELKGKPIVLDECQLEPDLFPALKDYARRHPAPGKFVLTGSVRFTSRKAIRESLTGRILSLELFPLSVSELNQTPLSEVLIDLIGTSRFSVGSPPLMSLPMSEMKRNEETFEKYLSHGGLPKLAFTRDPRSRTDLLNQLLGTLLDRDLRLVLETSLSLDTLREFLRQIALRSNGPWNSSEVRRELGLAAETQKNLIFAMESIYLIRKIPIRGRRGFLLWLEDQLEEYTLSGGTHSRSHQVATAFYRSVRTQFAYRPGFEAQFWRYQTPDGAWVPLVIEATSPHCKGILGFHFIEQESPSLSQRRSTDSFLRKYPEAKVIYVSSAGIPQRVLDPSAAMIPLGSLL